MTEQQLDELVAAMLKDTILYGACVVQARVIDGELVIVPVDALGDADEE